MSFEYWLTVEGQAVLQRAQELMQCMQGDTLRVGTRLRKEMLCSASIASQALEFVLCRQIARSYGDWTQKGFFTRQALEQATTPSIAQYHAERFGRCKHVLEICTGSAFDTVALAQRSERVTTLEANEYLAAMARYNLALQGITNVQVLCGHAEEICAKLDMGEFDGLWSDPSRRTPFGERVYAPKDYMPSLDWLQSLPIRGPKGIKISPIIDCNSRYLTGGWRREWIGINNECREQVLWSGVEECTDRTATLVTSTMPLYAYESWAPSIMQHQANVWGGDERSLRGMFLLEPHAALIRAGYLSIFFAERECMMLDERIAYGLSRILLPRSPWYQAFEIIEAMPFRYEHVRECLKELGWGDRIEIKKRGFPVLPEEIRAKLKLSKDISAASDGVLICTRKTHRHIALLARRVS
ncbi:MAG: hypothetical protein RML40_06245 [Bacteroidota bacterium]|nr:hypothetical protein [Candidatus Kapabacteria bacterium]MDW8220115.1 hypothetical protein [Bacteroidota bacterium]